MASICRSFLAAGLSYKESAYPSIAGLPFHFLQLKMVVCSARLCERGLIPQIMDIHRALKLNRPWKCGSAQVSNLHLIIGIRRIYMEKTIETRLKK